MLVNIKKALTIKKKLIKSQFELGIVAGIVDIGSGWTNSLKSGVCSSGFYLNREQCCWSSKSISYDDYKNVLCDEVG